MKLEDQLNHPFYQDVEEFRNEVKAETMIKAAEKYDEPFDPASWTGDELANHAMMENYDQSVYITGLRDHCRKLESMMRFQADIIVDLRDQIQKLLTRGES